MITGAFGEPEPLAGALLQPVFATLTREYFPRCQASATVCQQPPITYKIGIRLLARWLAGH